MPNPPIATAKATTNPATAARGAESPATSSPNNATIGNAASSVESHAEPIGS